MNRELIEAIWEHHSGKIVGALSGFLIATFILFFGFFHTLFVLFCIGIGYFIGKRIDEKEDIMDILERFLPPGYHR
ncbi:MAG: DUF2273 domain-containing protein [Sporomusaceae bacterium]|nr:DUF2273 domain-containing protein [Sporomusaceae bacterium]